MLIIMFNYIYKQNKKSSEVITARKNSLLKAFSIFHSIDIPFYNNCIVRRIQFYRTSFQDISRYKEYIFYNYSDCNILDILNKQLFHFTSQYIRLESEI